MYTTEDMQKIWRILIDAMNKLRVQDDRLGDP